MYPCLQSFCITAYISYQSQNTAEPFPRCVLSSLLSGGIWGCCAAPPGISFCPTARAGAQHPPWMGEAALTPWLTRGWVAKTGPARQGAPQRGIGQGMEFEVRTQRFILGFWGSDGGANLRAP